MTAQSTTPALNLRKSLVRLAGLVRRFDPPLRRVDFANLVTNGGFDTDSDWTKGTGWTISGGSATHVGPTSGAMAQSVGVVSGNTYACTVTVSNQTVGQLTWRVGDQTQHTAITGNGTYIQYIVSAGVDDEIELFASSIFDGSIDNVSVWEADPSDDAPWLRLPFGHKVGNRGMIVRDGDTLHPSDYEEITLYGQTFIKPLVAPGVDTEFSIWCSPSE